MAVNRPNVLIFFTDQQRADSTGVHGNPMGITPNFDRMAMNGTHCHHAFSCQPVCLPARMVLQTGKYASMMKCYSNAGRLSDDEQTLGHWFRQAGYRTGYIGKWHMTHDCDGERVPPENRTGYDDWLGANVVEIDSDAYSAFLYDGDGEKVELPGYRSDAYVDAVIRQLRAYKDRDQPFFLMSSYIEPHFQNTRDDYPAPTGYEEDYAKNTWTPPDLQALGGTAARHLPGYYGMIKRLDEGLGRIQDALRSLGLLDDTIVVYTCDHGCHFKTRNGEYKRSPHDSSIRIPLAFSGPGFDEGGRLKNMISLVDVPPTLLAACGIDIPDSMRGRSILPLIQGNGAAKEQWPESVLVEYRDGATMGRAARTKRWTYAVENRGQGDTLDFTEAFLYDNMADPWQLNNCVDRGGDMIKVKEVMRARLMDLLARSGEKEAVIHPAEITGANEQWRRSDSDIHA
ncbi:MAG: sulfatase-like hydrolase/transferase [Lentisphaeria bacterium]|nr:sulfatase-like hydrolase/transferase [Lentisphaeria bacterium]